MILPFPDFTLIYFSNLHFHTHVPVVSLVACVLWQAGLFSEPSLLVGFRRHSQSIRHSKETAVRVGIDAKRTEL